MKWPERIIWLYITTCMFILKYLWYWIIKLDIISGNYILPIYSTGNLLANAWWWGTFFMIYCLRSHRGCWAVVLGRRDNVRVPTNAQDIGGYNPRRHTLRAISVTYINGQINASNQQGMERLQPSPGTFPVFFFLANRTEKNFSPLSLATGSRGYDNMHTYCQKCNTQEVYPHSDDMRVLMPYEANYCVSSDYFQTCQC